MRAKNAISYSHSGSTSQLDTGEHRFRLQHDPESRQGYKNRADENRLFLKGHKNSHDKEA